MIELSRHRARLTSVSGRSLIAVDRCALAWIAVGAFLGTDWGVALAISIEGLGGVIPTAASVALVIAFGLVGGALGFWFASDRTERGVRG